MNALIVLLDLERHPYTVRGPRTIHLSNLGGSIEFVGRCSDLPNWMLRKLDDWKEATISGPGVSLSAEEIHRSWRDILERRHDEKSMRLRRKEMRGPRTINLSNLVGASE